MSDRSAQLHFQKDFTADEFSSRRAKLCANLRSGLVVLQGAPEVPGFDPFRQENDFYYLAGIEVPHAYLTIDVATRKSTLYLPPRNEKHESSDGPSLCSDDGEFVRARTGIREVRPLAALATDLSNQREVWLSRAPAEGHRQCQDTLRHHHRALQADPLDGRLSRESHLLARLSQLSPGADFRDLSPILQCQRLLKSPAELNVIRSASTLAARACRHAMAATRPGLREYHLAALANYVYESNGAQGAGYRPIVAAGKNIWMMHYWRNNAELKSGDLLILDYAPDYNNYTSDIGRMWPVSGTFSELQRELYGFVIACHRTLLSLIRPGRTKDEILAEAAGQLRPIVEQTAWTKPAYRAAALNLLASKRPLSHGVGMAVHESADWSTEPILPGLVFAVDPELFIPEEQIYIRVEDTVVVTEAGIEILTDDCPREIDDIEQLMRSGEPSLLASFPPFHANPGR